jgi:hypothetical protein
LADCAAAAPKRMPGPQGVTVAVRNSSSSNYRLRYRLIEFVVLPKLLLFVDVGVVAFVHIVEF